MTETTSAQCQLSGELSNKKSAKIFGVGHSKTGTTSLAAALKELGYTVGKQTPAERLLPDWSKRDFRRIAEYCETAQAFQDIPFSLPYTFQAMDMYFPNSKFVLTVRADPEQWYQSLVNFHKKIWGAENIAALSKLKELAYPAYKGFPYDVRVLVHDCTESDPYNKNALIAHYNLHNEMVRDYFRNRPDDLLILNVSEKGAYQKLCSFLGKPCVSEEMPWRNKT